jgi:hypothetical protein
MRVSRYRQFADAIPTPWEGTWDELCAQVLALHAYDGPKDQSPSWSPAEIRAGLTRANAHVVALHAAVLDIDDATQLGAIRAWLAGREGLLHSTYSHTAAAPRCRVVLPLTEPCPAADWPTIWRAIAHSLPVVIDPSCKDVARLYAEPYVPDLSAAIRERYTGAPLDWHALAQASQAAQDFDGCAPSQGAYLLIDGPSVDVLIAALRKGRPSRARLEDVQLLSAMRQGAALALRGGRHAAILRLTQLLDRHFPRGDIDSLGELARTSITRQAAQDGTYPEEDMRDFRRALAGARAKRERDQAQALAATAEHDRHAIEAATRGGRETPYTADDVARWAEAAGISTDEWERRWIIARDSKVWLWGGDRYLEPLARKDLRSAVRQWLTPAIVGGQLIVTKTTDKGETWLSVDEILARYAYHPTALRPSLIEPIGRVDRATGAFIEPVAPRRIGLEPRRSERVKGMLTAMFAEPHLADVTRWMAHIYSLDRPLGALVLIGDRGLGKSLLLTGLGRYWRADVTDLTKVIGDFGDALWHSPFCVLDDTMLVSRRGSGFDGEGLGILRDLISRNEHTVNRKGIPAGPLEGCLRVAIAQNDFRLYEVCEQLTPEAREATLERMVFAPVRAEARAFFSDLTQAQLDDLAQHEICEHALWLSTQGIERRGRFGVLGHNAKLGEAMLVGNSTTAACARWLISYLLDRADKLQNKCGFDTSLYVSARGGVVVANQRGFADADTWERYVSNHRVPSARALGRALRELSSADRLTVRDGARRWSGYVLDTQRLITFALNEGVSREELLDAMCICGAADDAATPSSADDPAPLPVRTASILA